jgi:uncharacterized protein YbjT (DUF2867 family)
MPVVVTGADSPVGRAVVPLLRERGSEVRATVRDPGDADHLRSLGAKVAVDALSDADTLRAVLDDAHTVCHLSEGLFPTAGESYEEAILESTRSLIETARKARVRRVLLVSYPGASSISNNDFLRNMGLAEEAVHDSGLEHAILRCTHLYGPGSPWLEFMIAASRRNPAVIVGDGSQRLAPIFSADVAGALAAADDRAQPVSDTYGLQGPEVISAGELADVLGAPGTPKRYVGPQMSEADRSTLQDALGVPLSRTIMEVLVADSLADARDAAPEFGLERTALVPGLATSGLEPIRWPTRSSGRANRG